MPGAGPRGLSGLSSPGPARGLPSTPIPTSRASRHGEARPPPSSSCCRPGESPPAEPDADVESGLRRLVDGGGDLRGSLLISESIENPLDRFVAGTTGIMIADLLICKRVSCRSNLRVPSSRQSKAELADVLCGPTSDHLPSGCVV